MYPSDLYEFCDKMQIHTPDYPMLLEPQNLTRRLVYMLEELSEFSKASREEDLPRAADALVDLVYFAMGSAMQMGLPWADLWKVVHAANMKKVPGIDKYGQPGIIKPAQWVSPDAAIAYLIEAAKKGML